MNSMSNEWQAVQQMLTSPEAIEETREQMREGASTFWDEQEKILESAEDFTKGWFERRHTGTRAALEASRRICTAKSPAEAAKEWQAWAKGATERVAADGAALQKHLMTIASVLSKPWGKMPMQEPGGETPAPEAEARQPASEAGAETERKAA